MMRILVVNSDVINMINEKIMALKIHEKIKIIYATTKQKMKASVKDFSVNVIKPTFSCVFG